MYSQVDSTLDAIAMRPAMGFPSSARFMTRNGGRIPLYDSNFKFSLRHSRIKKGKDGRYAPGNPVVDVNPSRPYSLDAANVTHLPMFSSKLRQYSSGIGVLQQCFPGRRYASMLDLGCGYGLHLRLAKYFGLTQHVTGLDASPMKDLITTKEFDFFKKLLTAYLVDGEIIPDLASRFHVGSVDAEYKARAIADYMSKLLDWRAARHVGFQIPFAAGKTEGNADKCEIDDFIVARFEDLDTSVLKEKFELVTSFSFLVHADLRQAMAKIAGMLRPGGVLLAVEGNFFHPTGSHLHLPMGAAWLHAMV
ncbi:MAG: methyltransferase domain-containing protein, partial [Alphaproteobacteria bacterium]|nr:methyltransferase domain-containing protein [Alphaproteobacteria bacterium]